MGCDGAYRAMAWCMAFYENRELVHRCLGCHPEAIIASRRASGHRPELDKILDRHFECLVAGSKNGKSALHQGVMRIMRLYRAKENVLSTRMAIYRPRSRVDGSRPIASSD